mmetsp:Transcript_52826/g.128981  ORF Transcript_52826/g.128981 Transcript_52826/m.128981 type:complete len:206 (-) Transcript_52826:1429-2046(-)
MERGHFVVRSVREAEEDFRDARAKASKERLAVQLAVDFEPALDAVVVHRDLLEIKRAVRHALIPRELVVLHHVHEELSSRAQHHIVLDLVVPDRLVAACHVRGLAKRRDSRSASVELSVLQEHCNVELWCREDMAGGQVAPPLHVHRQAPDGVGRRLEECRDVAEHPALHRELDQDPLQDGLKRLRAQQHLRNPNRLVQQIHDLL